MGVPAGMALCWGSGIYNNSVNTVNRMRKKIQKVKDKAQATLEKHLLPPDPGFRRRAHAPLCVR